MVLNFSNAPKYKSLGAHGKTAIESPTWDSHTYNEFSFCSVKTFKYSAMTHPMTKTAVYYFNCWLEQLMLPFGGCAFTLGDYIVTERRPCYF